MRVSPALSVVLDLAPVSEGGLSTSVLVSGIQELDLIGSPGSGSDGDLAWSSNFGLLLELLLELMLLALLVDAASATDTDAGGDEGAGAGVVVVISCVVVVVVADAGGGGGVILALATTAEYCCISMTAASSNTCTVQLVKSTEQYSTVQYS